MAEDDGDITEARLQRQAAVAAQTEADAIIEENASLWDRLIARRISNSFGHEYDRIELRSRKAS